MEPNRRETNMMTNSSGGGSLTGPMMTPLDQVIMKVNILEMNMTLLAGQLNANMQLLSKSVSHLKNEVNILTSKVEDLEKSKGPLSQSPTITETADYVLLQGLTDIDPGHSRT